MSGNENMRVFFANVYSLQMMDGIFIFKLCKKQHSGAEMKGLCMGGLN